MCIGAIVHAKISGIVFGAYTPKLAWQEPKIIALIKPYHNHQVEIKGGVLEVDCAELLKGFFRGKRGAR